MRNALKNIFANVLVKECDKIILEQSNLFVETGRGLIRDIFTGDVVFDDTKYVVEFGSSTQVPSEADIDIITPISPAAYTNNYTVGDVGSTEIDFVFTYENTGLTSVSFNEIGLFYRPAGPDPGAGRVDAGTLMARLKSTYTSITIGAGKTVTITWKIIF